MLWNMGGLAETILWRLAQHPLPVAYFIDDRWLLHKVQRLQQLGWPWSLPLKRFTWHHIVFNSQALQHAYAEGGFPIEESSVILGGIDLKPFLDVGSPRTPPERLLFVGHIRPPKGVLSLVEALALLRLRGHDRLTLTLTGPSHVPKYAQQVRQRIAELGLEDCIHFTGRLPHQALPSLYAEHDVLIFPSIDLESLGLTIMEAQAAGLPVIATPMGGPAELVAHNQNGLLFEANNPASLAEQVERLIAEPDLVSHLRQSGMKTARERYDVRQTILETEQYLKAMIAGG
jgi:glycosyltransferase involved in cell wall biosynthesis